MLTSIAVIESVGGIEVLALLVNCTRSSVAVTCRCKDHGGDRGVKDHNDDVDDYVATVAIIVMVMVMVVIIKVIRDAPQDQCCIFLNIFQLAVETRPLKHDDED